MMTVLVKAYFSMSSFGFILGFVMFLTAIGQIIGPALAGWIYDMWGSYQGAWIGLAVLIFLTSLIMATTPQAREVHVPSDHINSWLMCPRGTASGIYGI